jgi:GR25 family glycosyltransferase involved in LPS biosynthesis
VYGKNISDDELYSNFIFEGDKNRSKVEYACLLSHLKAFLLFQKSNYKNALILEDDMTLEYAKYWDKPLSTIMNNAPKDWDIIMMNYITNINLKDLYTINTNGIIYSTGAYIININSVNKLLNQIYVNNKFKLLNGYIHTADNYIFSLLTIYTYKFPYFIYNDINDSNINDLHIYINNSSKKKLLNKTWYKNNYINNEHLNNYLQGIDIIYWINLDTAIDRRRIMEGWLARLNIPHVRISAVDGRNMSDDELYANFIFEDNLKKMKKVEYACLLSHLKTLLLFQKIIAEGKKYQNALILEDDMTLEYTKYWNKPISVIMNEAPLDWEIIMMNYNIRDQNVPSELYILNTSKTTNVVNIYASTGAYIININGVNNLLNKIYNDGRFVLKKYYFHHADIYIYNLVTTYVYKYPYFIYKDNNDSDIRDDFFSLNWQTSVKKLIFNKTWKIEAFNNYNVYELFYMHTTKIIILFICIILTIYILIYSLFQKIN